DQPGRTLSGGERQLVALARALVLQPLVLLLDEPTANIDPTYVGLIEDVLQELRVGRSTTIVCATHNLHQARRIADRASLILNGDIVESGLVDDFFQRPHDPRTAAFVQGKMVC
ncbi:MAG: ATP-binding cassette domain-containing protein, partial [Planctomycetaceae bacterium]|nr:ATP-binding cassette domain-containing protein [Planctomycetaceae bacterium]